jgi:uncharacterized membrane protein YfcA
VGFIIDQRNTVINNSLWKRLLEYEHIIVLLVIPVFLIVLLSQVHQDPGYWLVYLWVFPVAFCIALVVNMLGVSGALLFVPFFSVIMPLFTTGFGPSESVIIGLFTQSFGISSATLGFFRYGLIDLKVACTSLFMVIPIVIGSSLIAFSIPKKLLFLIICVALFGAVFSMYYSKRLIKELREEKSENITILVHLHSGNPSPAIMVDRFGKVYSYCRCGYRIRMAAHSIGAFLQGITGSGIGYLGMIGMIMSGIPIRVGIGSNHIVIAVSAIIASVTYLVRSASSPSLVIPWNVIAITVPAVIIGAQFSPYAADRVNRKTLETMFSGLLFILAVYTLYISFLI